MDDYKVLMYIENPNMILDCGIPDVAYFKNMVECKKFYNANHKMLEKKGYTLTIIEYFTKEINGKG